MALIVKKGDFSNHRFGGSNGYIISVTTTVTSAEGEVVARVGDFHVCPIPGHGITPIINGSGNIKVEGKIVACTGSFTGCGAALIPSSINSNVPLEPPKDAATLDGPKVLGGPDVPLNDTMIMG